ncbi:MAG: metallophosphoesterase [Bacteroidota bacterium]
MSRFIFFAVLIGFFLLLDFISYSGLKSIIKDIKKAQLRKSLRILALVASITKILAVFILVIVYGFSYREFQGVAAVSNALLFLIMIPQLFFVLIMLTEDVFRIGEWILKRLNLIEHKSVAGEEGNGKGMEGRRKFVTQLGLGIAAVPFFGVMHGVTRGKYAFTVRKVSLKIPELPKAFHGFKLAQISDVHSGSFDNPDKVFKGIELVNEQNADLIAFTGDLVNNKASEIEPWIDAFKVLEAPFGKYSILGNHDYGHYVSWSSKQEEEDNLKRLIENHAKMGFQLLQNENRILEKDGDKIALLGVENWGKGGFPKYGDLDQALAGAEEMPIKILLSHDPSHWDQKVLEHNQKIHLTLSGHTHGMQFGIEIPGIKWSPVKYRYPRWAGLYEEAEQYLYVNRGFGFLAFPGRVGIWPEVTLIELQQA